MHNDSYPYLRPYCHLFSHVAVVFAAPQWQAVELTYLVLDLDDLIAVIDYVVLKMFVARSKLECLAQELVGSYQRTFSGRFQE